MSKYVNWPEFALTMFTAFTIGFIIGLTGFALLGSYGIIVSWPLSAVIGYQLGKRDPFGAIKKEAIR